jgi:hypothetical protein
MSACGLKPMLYLPSLLGGYFMQGKVGAGSAQAAAATDMTDARSMALNLMSRALGHLDSDSNIPPIIGAQLQTAIDALWTSVATDRPSTDLH